ncbi:MAG: DUF4837 domain-containing protein [Chitinophagales bacterium]|nr:MAG: DUF4837 domain-containing protein [Chitinophagales bacterium]
MQPDNYRTFFILRELNVFPSIARLLLLAALFLISACQRSAPVSNSLGGFDEIVIVADKSHLDKYLKQPLLEIFRAPYEVLPQDEPLFDARVISYEDFDKVFPRFRTIIFAADLSDNTPVTRLVTDQLGEDNLMRALNNPDFCYAVKKNIWAQPQTVIFIFAPSAKELLHTLSSRSGKILEIASQSELEKYKNNAYFNGINTGLVRQLKNQGNLNFKIPADYVLALNEDQFFWIRKIADKYDNHILIDQRRLSDKPDAVAWRNALGRKYISSKIEGSYMTTDTLLPFVISEKIIQNYRVIETRGLWKMVNDFMGGPFINYLIFDPDNDRIILLDGFVFAPGEKNKPQIRTLEAIFSEFGKP